MSDVGQPGGHLGDRLSALLDGELAGAEAEAARSHVAGCALCASELAAVERVRGLVRSLPSVGPPVPLELRRTDRRTGVVSLVAAVAAAVAFLLVASVQAGPASGPSLARLMERHATSVLPGEPLSEMAPPAIPTRLLP